MSARANPLYNAQELTRQSGADGVRSDEVGRTPFRKDYGRLLHAASFRRLQGKTQLYPGLESDFFRNRLSHSLEVAQIARGIAATLNATSVPDAFADGRISEDLVEFAAIAHDLGHPPFGHNGEHALDEIMREDGGFEGNAQTLRILTRVERKLVNGQSTFGLDLTHRSLASVLKYDKRIQQKRAATASVAKGYYGSEREIVDTLKDRVAPGRSKSLPFKTIECAIMDVADDIAYSTYDLEDSLHAGFVTPSHLAEGLAAPDVNKAVTCKVNEALNENGYQQLQDGELLQVLGDAFDIQAVAQPPKGSKSAKALLAVTSAAMQDRAYVSDSLLRSKFTSQRVGRLIAGVDLVPDKKYPQLSHVRLKRAELLQVEVFKRLNYELIIRSTRLAVVQERGHGVIKQIFDCFEKSRGALLPKDWLVRYEEAQPSKGITLTSARRRVICDYISSMTDRYAVEVHARLFGEGLTIFKPL